MSRNVIHTTKAMLNAGLLENSEEERRPSVKQICQAGYLEPMLMQHREYNHAAIPNEASLKVFLRNESNPSPSKGVNLSLYIA